MKVNLTKPVVVTLMGYSGAGKDTVCKMLNQHLGANHLDLVNNIKFSRPMKDFVESCYGLPKGFLDDPELRLQKLPKLDLNGLPDSTPDKTYLDVMISLFHLWQEVDDTMSARKVDRNVRMLLKSKAFCCFTDIRKPVEVGLLLKAVDDYDAKLITVYLQNDRVVPRAADIHIPSLVDLLYEASDVRLFINNSGTLEQLEDKVHNLYLRDLKGLYS